MIILNHLRTAHFPRMDNFSTLFCRSSDSFPVHRLPVLPEEQWHKYDTPSMELTAAGLFGTFTRFPFHPLLRIENAKQNAGKDRNIYNKSINLTTVSSKKHSLFYKKHNLTPFCEKVTDERKNGHIYKSIMLP